MNEFYSSLNRLIRLLPLVCLLFSLASAQAQTFTPEKDYSLLHYRVHHSGFPASAQQDTTDEESYPDPNSVMYKSMILPGWGQVINKQAWKIPIIYGLFAGLGYYTYDLTQQYHDYRAAYYNLSRGADTDYKFGETPDYIPESIGLNELRDLRNETRNRRDTMYIVTVLAYGLNIVDAYVYAHMRSFDVSDDLSANTQISPGLVDGMVPGINVRVNLQTKRR